MKSGVYTADIYRLDKDKKKERKKEERRLTFDELIENYTQDEKLQEVLKKHLIVRKKGNSLTNDSIITGFEALEALTKNTKEEDKTKHKIKIVKQSIANGWSGFFEIKTNEIKRNNYEKQVVSSEEWEQLYDN